MTTCSICHLQTEAVPQAVTLDGRRLFTAGTVVISSLRPEQWARHVVTLEQDYPLVTETDPMPHVVAILQAVTALPSAWDSKVVVSAASSGPGRCPETFYQDPISGVYERNGAWPLASSATSPRSWTTW